MLGPYTPANVEFAKSQGFTNMILSAGHRSTLDATNITDAQVEDVKATLSKFGMHVSALQIDGSHIDPDPQRRAQANEYFVKAIDMAGKLGVRYIGTQSGKDNSKSFPDQIDEIVRVYTEKYFPACQRNNVRILWEPYPDSPNLAVSPVGFEALFKGFGDSPYVGLQYDPSHLVRGFMDPIETARIFVDKIYDVHLKDTEIIWPVLRAGGINPVNHAHWWRYRIPGMGQIVWRDFFTVSARRGILGCDERRTGGSSLRRRRQSRTGFQRRLQNGLHYGEEILVAIRSVVVVVKLEVVCPKSRRALKHTTW